MECKDYTATRTFFFHALRCIKIVDTQQREQVWREASSRYSEPLYVVALRKGVSISTVYIWRRFGIVPRRPESRAKLAELLGIRAELLEEDAHAE